MQIKPMKLWLMGLIIKNSYILNSAKKMRSIPGTKPSHFELISKFSAHFSPKYVPKDNDSHWKSPTAKGMTSEWNPSRALPIPTPIASKESPNPSNKDSKASIVPDESKSNSIGFLNMWMVMPKDLMPIFINVLGEGSFWSAWFGSFFNRVWIIIQVPIVISMQTPSFFENENGMTLDRLFPANKATLV